MYKTDKEILIGNSIYAFKMRKLLDEDKKTFLEIAEFLPFYVHLNKRNNLFWIWGNESSLNLFGFNEQPVYSDILKVSDMEVLDHYTNQVRNYSSKNAYWSSCKFLQYMETLDGWKWIHTTKVIVNDEDFVNYSFFLNNKGITDFNSTNLINIDISENDKWLNYSTLTKSEKLILELVCSGKSNSNISEKLSVSKNTVRKHRENINKKLNIRTIRDLLSYNKIIGLRNYL